MVTLPSTVMFWNRLKLWNTIAMRSRAARRLARSA